MPHTDPRIDAYIAKSADFARPILEHLRKVVHQAAPDVRETIKWGMPHFERNGMLCGMAAFKQHCTFGFWNDRQVFEDSAVNREAMGQFGCIRKVADLPAKKAIVGYVKKAVALDEAGVKRTARPRVERGALKVPADLAAALKRSAKAKKAFDGFSPSAKREYVEWITEAKRAETRAKRLATGVEWMAEGKTRHWKYQNC